MLLVAAQVPLSGGIDEIARKMLQLRSGVS
jgi:hypothetical protein